jgi:hypothetical protein
MAEEPNEALKLDAEKRKAAKPEKALKDDSKTDRPPEGEDVEDVEEVSRDDAHAWR